MVDDVGDVDRESFHPGVDLRSGSQAGDDDPVYSDELTVGIGRDEFRWASGPVETRGGMVFDRLFEDGKEVVVAIRAGEAVGQFGGAGKLCLQFWHCVSLTEPGLVIVDLD